MKMTRQEFGTLTLKVLQALQSHPYQGLVYRLKGVAFIFGIKSNGRLSFSLHLILVIALRAGGPYDKYNYKHKYKYKFRTKSDKYILHTTLIFLQSVACLPNLEQSVSQSVSQMVVEVVYCLRLLSVLVDKVHVVVH